MLEEAMVVWAKFFNFMARREAAKKSKRHWKKFEPEIYNPATGEGETTLETEIALSPGMEVRHPVRDPLEAKPRSNESVLAINERHLDLVSGFHQYRGALSMPGVGFVWLGLHFATHFAVGLFSKHAAGIATTSTWLAGILMILMYGSIAWLVWYAAVSFDWFHYRANPIRFDRERRLVHVWRSKRVGGPISVPWNESLVQIRGWHDPDSPRKFRVYPMTFLSIDPETRLIKRRFVVGKLISTDRAQADAFYEYIRRFMEEGRAAVPTPRYYAKMTPSLLYSFNCWFNVTGTLEYLAKGKRISPFEIAFMLLISPLFALLALSHFIAILTSRTPKWPPEMS